MPSKNPAGVYFVPAPGLPTQFDITIIDPANMYFYLPILTHTALLGNRTIAKNDQQAYTQKVRCRAVADGSRMVATLALFITELVDPQKFRDFFLFKIPKIV